MAEAGAEVKGGVLMLQRSLDERPVAAGVLLRCKIADLGN